MSILESQIFVKVRLNSISLNASPLIDLFDDNYNSLDIISFYLNQMVLNVNVCMLNVFENIELSELESFTDVNKECLIEDFICLYREIIKLISNITIKNYSYCSLIIEKPDTLILEYRESRNIKYEHKQPIELPQQQISDSVYTRSFFRR